MSKGNVKSQILAKVAGLLDKFSDRLVATARETRQNTDAIAALRDELRLKFGKLEGELANTDGRIDASLEKADEREGRQTLRDQNNVQSLTALRDSTAKAFTQVRADVEELLKRIQRLNERAGQVESQNAILVSGQKLIPNQIDQKIVNAKLEGIYDVTGDLEVRIQYLESLLALYEGLRKAQNDLAVANGAFLAGPKS